MSNTNTLVKTFHFIHLIKGNMTESLADLDIGTQQARIIRFISKNDGCSAKDFAKDAACDPAGIGRALDSLEKKDLIKRAEHPTDRRLWILHLTPKGKKLLQKLNVIIDHCSNEIFSQLSSKEREQYEEIIAKLSTFLENKINK